MKLKKEQEAELMQVYNTWCNSYLNGDVKTYDSFLADDYHFVGSFDATAHQLTGKAELRNVTRKIEELIGGLILITDLADAYVVGEPQWVFYSRFRFTSLMQETEHGWRFIYQHFSVPDTKAKVGEALGTEQITKENLELRDAIKRRTVELEHKSRELEIEASLERVRAVAMGMTKPDDLLEICKQLYAELQLLGFNELRNTMIHRFFDDKKYFINYDYSEATGGSISTIPYHGNSLMEKFIRDIRKANDSFSELEIAGVELEEWKSFRQANGEYDDPRLNDIHALYYYNYSVGETGIGISTYSAISTGKLSVLKRFRNVFDLSYKRYIDITKAEAQAREAQVQLALERVRAGSMAMHKSEELADLSLELVKQVQELGVPTWFCAFNINDEDPNSSVEWGSNGKGTFPQYRTPREGVFLRYYEAGKRGETFLINEIGEDECPAHYKYLCSLPGVGDQLLQMKDAGIPFPASQIDHVAFFRYGYLLFITYEPAPEAHDIFMRFAKVFEQTYTRFLDLKKAEAQAREAQIESALERVRSRAMAMHNSEELSALIGTVFTELTKLELVLTRCLIMIFNEETNDSKWWMANSEDPENPMGLYIKQHDHPPITAYFKAWRDKKLKWNYVLEGQIKKEWDDFIFSETELSQLPGFVQEGMRAPDRINLNVSFNNFGCITLASMDPLPDEHFDIMLRFSKVFDQTYTPFNDLKQAEAQAKEAMLEAALERVRAKTMGMQRSDELQDAALLLFQQIQELGIPPFSCGFNIWDEDRKSATAWMGSVRGLQPPFRTDSSKDIYLPIYEAAQKGESLLVIEQRGKDLETHYQYLASIPVFRDIILPELKQAGFSLPTFQIIHCAFFSQGYLMFITYESCPYAYDIYVRFAKVFEQTYTRFLDLQKAEAQALRAEKDLIEIKVARKKAEEALIELQETQKQLIQSEKMASLGELTAGIAHEIQNPLNFVNNFSDVSTELIDEMMEEVAKGNFEEVKALADDIKQNLVKISHHGKRADGIVKGMLQHSRSSSGQREPTNINALADEYLRLAYHGLRAKDKSFNALLKTAYDETISNINVIPQDIGRVILNLITNAFYAVNEKKNQTGDGYEPTVSISTQKLGSNVEVTVMDNGNGIPNKILDKIFQPFFTTKPTGQGTGLGLSLSYDIIKAHGGELQVKTKEGEGSEFIIQLPSTARN